MSARKPKRRSYWSPAAVTGRVIWGRGGFKGAMRRLRREWFGPRTVVSIRPGPNGGKLKIKGLRQRKDGTFEYRPPRPKKKVTAKQRIAEMQTRVAKESDRHAAYLKAQKKPMTERVNRKPNGTFNGSDKTTVDRPDAAENAYLRALRNAERAQLCANQLLGYRD